MSVKKGGSDFCLATSLSPLLALMSQAPCWRSLCDMKLSLHQTTYSQGTQFSNNRVSLKVNHFPVETTDETQPSGHLDHNHERPEA